MELILAPNPIFKQKAEIVTEFDDKLKETAESMMAILKAYEAIGLGANMVGVLQRIIIAPLSEEDITAPMIMINPEITKFSEKTQIVRELSLSFPTVEADIKRPSEIELTYQTLTGEKIHTTVSGFAATVVQHEMDYLDGKTFLDYIPKAKAQLLKEKMSKFIKKGGFSKKSLAAQARKDHKKSHSQDPNHIHGPDCGHDH